jgi:hypothetical protein
VVEGARVFGPAVARAFADPRSHVHVEDAKTFFARNRSRYDIIMSEPSNPWVSGVASLFSVEFYGQVRRYLKPGGLFVQWLQLYEFDLPLLASVLEALGSRFEDYAIYATNSGDILIAAVPHGRVPAPSATALASSPLRGLLDAIDVRTPADIALRRIGDKRELARFVADLRSPANSDYRPYVDQNAVKRRFLRSNATAFEHIGAINRELADPVASAAPASASAHYPAQDRAAQARTAAEYFAWQSGRRGPPRGTLNNSVLDVVFPLRALHSQCEGLTLKATWVPAMGRFGEAMIADLDAEAVRAIVADLRSARCHAGAPPEVRDWISFLEAAALHRDEDVRRYGEALVKAARTAGERVPGVVMRELLISDLRRGDAPAARARFADFAADLSDDAAVRYLRSRTEALLDRGQR